MRKINFKVRNIGSEKYLSYVLDDDCDFDEELLDYLEDNNIVELIDIIYEEDDENDYLTYNVTDRITVESLFSNTVNAEIMLGIVRGIASGIVNMRDLGIPVSYVVLNKGFTYVNPVTYDVKMICVPVETDSSINTEFKLFIKQLITDATYSDREDCNYVAKLINMLNEDKFTVRTFLGEITELMESAGMQIDGAYMDVGDSGVEVSQSTDKVSDTTIDDLPEFDDVSFDDEEDDGLDMYGEEPKESNSIFKDLDLDEEKAAAEEINMDAFDDSALQELEIDDLDSSKEPETESDLETNTQDNIRDVTEVAETADGVTEIEVARDEKEEPTLIDTEDIDNLIETPPVVKNIRINRAKIIQKATVEPEGDITDNPTEQIISPEFLKDNDEEPEEAETPVLEETSSEEKKSSETNSESVDIAMARLYGLDVESLNTTPMGNTVELTENMNAVENHNVTAAAEESAENSTQSVSMGVPYLTRVNTGEKAMISKTVYKIGKAARGVDFSIKGNGAISRIHATIYQREDGCYLKDNKATNATYVNGVKLEENQEVLLKNDSTINIGGEDFIFKIG